MHELSIAEAVLAVARHHAGSRRLAAVRIEVGHLRQVVPEALAFAFDLLAPGVELEIVEVPAEGACRACGTVTVFDGFPLACAACASLDMEIVRGEELLVESLEVERSESASGRVER
jgi:hydrogenase nickel incorporation protein HypA/HybF